VPDRSLDLLSDSLDSLTAGSPVAPDPSMRA
jgi:hypothetical protein